MMQNTVNQRIKILRNELRLSQAQFADAIGLKQGSYSDIERGKAGLSGSIKRIIENLYNVNVTWLETGEGDMLKPSNILREPNTEYKVDLIKTASVPIYDVEFSAGVMASLIENREDHYPVGYLGIPEVFGCDAIIRAKGDSMADRINDRDWIGIKRLNKDEWFPMGYIYAIETDQAQVIKYLKKGSANDTFKIVSHNAFYEDDEIPKNLIRELWSVRVVLPFSKIETLI